MNWIPTKNLVLLSFTFSVMSVSFSPFLHSLPSLPPDRCCVRLWRWSSFGSLFVMFGHNLHPVANLHVRRAKAVLSHHLRWTICKSNLYVFEKNFILHHTTTVPSRQPSNKKKEILFTLSLLNSNKQKQQKYVSPLWDRSSRSLLMFCIFLFVFVSFSKMNKYEKISFRTVWLQLHRVNHHQSTIFIFSLYVLKLLDLLQHLKLLCNVNIHSLTLTLTHNHHTKFQTIFSPSSSLYLIFISLFFYLFLLLPVCGWK